MEGLEAGAGSERRGQVESLSGMQLLHLYDLTKRLGALEPIRFPCPRLAAIVSNRRLHSVRYRQTVKCAEYRLRCTADKKGLSAVECAELSSPLLPQQRPYSIMVRMESPCNTHRRRSSAAEARTACRQRPRGPIGVASGFFAEPARAAPHRGHLHAHHNEPRWQGK
jgi:hypothetical protein